MDTAALRRRREHLELRIKRQEDAAQARTIGRRLHAAGVRRISRLPSARARELLHAFVDLPQRDERFHWPEIPGHQRLGWRDDSERNAAFVAGLHACFDASQRLVLVFHPWQSALVIGAADLAAHCALLLDALYESLWIVPLQGAPALVEVSVMDDELCWLE